MKMLIPITDSFPKRRVPKLTLGLCCLLVAVWVAQPPLDLYSTAPLGRTYDTWALSKGAWLSGEAYRLVSHLFLHGHIVHLLFNVWGLWFFGSRLEEKWGGARVLGAFLLCGVVGGAFLSLAQIVTGRMGIGSSAAVFGLMALYLLERADHDLAGFSLFIPLVLRGRIWFALVVTLNLIGAIISVPDLACAAHLAGIFAGFLLHMLTCFSPLAFLNGIKYFCTDSCEDENRRFGTFLGLQA